MGDFNFPVIDWDNLSHRSGCGSVSSKHFLQFVKDSGLVQLVNKPTHNLNLLDIVLTSHSLAVKDIKVLAPFSTSDHNTITFAITDASSKTKRNFPQQRDFAKGDYESIIRNLTEIDWVTILSSTSSADECYAKFTRICYDLIQDHIPLVRQRLDKRTYSTLPRSIRYLRSKVGYYYKNINKYGRAVYEKFARRLKRKLTHLAALEEEHIANSKNTKKFFKYCNAKLKLSVDIPNLKHEGSDIEVDSQKADLFADYFESVYKNPIKTDAKLDITIENVLNWVDISSETVYRALCKLPNRCSTSPDDIPYYFLKHAALGLSTPLTVMFNKFLLLGDVPNIWRLGLVRPIHKKGARDKVENYRPVCLTCSISKVMERLICKAMTEFLSANGLLSNVQHGFLRRRSTTSALITTIPVWQREIDRGNFVSACFIDYRKAFDSISIPLLLGKIQSFGIAGRLYDFLKSFLTNRSQSVIINSDRSRTYPTPSGVPQGTCLGPLLFLMYINDLPPSTTSRFLLCNFRR
ncbi:hypothetical protein Y032_0006g3022 [Ancylostoma ceylanicum]|uniref:Reverse transcriptase domain-containing protein n=1 Tax=Ancylostoma ceylanicum TaxID=53326 RepID=A0A016VQH3_9BILA|nr:hypothetical protein Y032_0006g3022 [Ancylostoma ceylanicum]